MLSLTILLVYNTYPVDGILDLSASVTPRGYRGRWWSIRLNRLYEVKIDLVAAYSDDIDQGKKKEVSPCCD